MTNDEASRTFVIRISSFVIHSLFWFRHSSFPSRTRLMKTFVRTASVVFGIALLALAAGFALEQPWATRTWPWPDGRLTYIFVASILAAIGAPVIWIGASREWAAAAGGALNLVITFDGTAWVMFNAYRRDGRPHLRDYAIGFAIAAVWNVGLLIWGARLKTIDHRRMPHLVRASFVMFAITLVVVGILLLRRAPTIFPWPLNPDTSQVVGFIFLGAAAYFVWAVMRARWHDARGQLIGFLAYDLVLIGPFLAHASRVQPEHRQSLIVYLVVITYSGFLAAYFLFFHPRTRQWRIVR
jgi:hypothetical protein